MAGENVIIKTIQFCLVCTWVILLLMALGLVAFMNPSLFLSGDKPSEITSTNPIPIKENFWVPPDTASIPKTPEGKLIRYGYNLVAHTSIYLGPKGIVAQISNGMNCQNCHLNAGTKFLGNNYSAVASTYPKLRPRSGTVETIEKRVNDCIERSLNGTALGDESKEMKAFVAYIKWVGQAVPKDSIPKGAGILNLKFLDRAADSIKGKLVYQTHCTRCHGAEGKGEMAENGVEWKYPPLYGERSYNIGAGLYRLSRFAGYVKVNMPNDVPSSDKLLLTDEEAWDVAAYVNSLPRPLKDLSKDWPDISKKPFDHPFGPFTDQFPEDQHKYGPFVAIKKK